MSQELITQLQRSLEAMQAQFNASNQMYNDAVTNNLQLKTQAILGQNQVQQLTTRVAELEKSLADATVRIDELTKTNATLD